MGVRQAEALAGRARRQKDGPHGGGDAQAVRVHVTGDELHRVVNRQARGDGAAGGVDVHVDVFFRVGHLEEQKLGNHGVRHIVVNGGTDEDDAVLQEAGVNVKGSFGRGRPAPPPWGRSRRSWGLIWKIGLETCC